MSGETFHVSLRPAVLTFNDYTCQTLSEKPPAWKRPDISSHGLHGQVENQVISPMFLNDGHRIIQNTQMT